MISGLAPIICLICDRPEKTNVPDATTVPTRVLFLDVDGVLACERSQLYDYEDDDKSLIHHSAGKYPPLEVRCVAELRRIQQATECSIVLSTSWRIDPDMRKHITKVLHDELGDGVVASCTPVLRGQDRGEEIVSWLGAHRATRQWCILDDQHQHAFARAGLVVIID